MKHALMTAFISRPNAIRSRQTTSFKPLETKTDKVAQIRTRDLFTALKPERVAFKEK